MYLAEQQRTFFETFGFLAFPGLFAAEIEAITQAFEDIWQRQGGGHAGKAHDGTARSALAQFIDQDERLCALLDDPRILEIASGLLGEDFNYSGSDGNFYVGDTNWHSDGWRRNGIRYIKMAFYLDPVDANSGCLRVIPGSCHTEDRYAQALQAQIRQSQELWGIDGRAVPAVALATKPGDLILFNHNLKHAAFGGGSRRRMFTMNLSQRYPAELLPELRETIAGASRFWVERTYGEIMIRTAGPERMRHLEQKLANDGHLAELSRKARETMAEPARG
jgi:ectoine hydroxylase-related dioxygenase (phytanoyl-CoA dioxygenase family)